MNNRFFSRALDAANLSVEAFEAEFKTEDANPNAREFQNTHNEYGEPLIHKLIAELPDASLPTFLSVLIKNGVDLEYNNPAHFRPLAIAALYGKSNALEFLIANQAIVHLPANSSSMQPLLAAINGKTHQKNTDNGLVIVKALVEKHQTNVNINSGDGNTALINAARENSLEILEYLLSQGADLFSTSFGKSALSHAYINYNSSIKTFCLELKYTTTANLCLDALLRATYRYLYHVAVHYTGIKENLIAELEQYLFILAGDFEHDNTINSKQIKNLLDRKVLQPLLAQLEQEQQQRLAFCLGSKARLQNEKNNGYAINTAYFRNSLFERNSVAMIFSYIHEETPKAVEDLEEKQIRQINK